MMKLMAATAVGAVTGAAIFNAQPVAAADGHPVVLGQINESTVKTNINNIGNGSALVLNSQNQYGSKPTSTRQRVVQRHGTEPVLERLAQPARCTSTVSVTRGRRPPPTQPSARWRKLASASSAGHCICSTPAGLCVRLRNATPLNPNEARTVDTTLGGTAVRHVERRADHMTISGPQAPGFATAWPAGPWPGTSNINFAPGQDIAATAIVGCGPTAISRSCRTPSPTSSSTSAATTSNRGWPSGHRRRNQIGETLRCPAFGWM